MTVREPKKRSNLRLKLGGAYFSAQRKLRWLLRASAAGKT